MEYIENKRLGEGYYKEILDNGLTVFVYPMMQKSSVYAMLSSPVGSSTLGFTVNGEEVNVPQGIAHFLEHKMFENEDGIDAFELFAKTGASANAYTSFDKTCYLFEASLNAKEALRTILGFVGSPYFTDETVAKEQGIIAQEIKMYRDHPGWRQMFELLKLLYHEHPVRYDIAGSVESIAEITKEKLHDFYNAFYNPKSMVLSVCGNISFEEVVKLCEEEFRIKEWKKYDSKVLRNTEPDSIAADYVKIEMPISSPQFSLGYKEVPFKKQDRVKNEVILDMLLDIIAGETSELFRRLYDSNLINGDLSSETLSGDDYLCVIFSAESNDPDKAVDEIKKEIDFFKKNGIPDSAFLECKRMNIGGTVGIFDDISAVAAGMTYSHFKESGLFDEIEMLDSISKQDVESMLMTTLQSDRAALSLLVPSEE